MQTSVIIEKKENIATIFLNEHETLNAFSQSLKEQLKAAFVELGNDPQISVIILAGKGRAFCAGGHIKEMKTTLSALENKRNMEYTAELTKLIYECNKIVISVIHGYAAGAGFSLALAADLVIAEEGSQFVLSFKNVGLIPDLGAHFFLAQLVGPWKAKEWIWSGKKFTVEEGIQYGFVNECVELDEGLKRAEQLAQELASGPIQAFLTTKNIMNRASTLSLNEVLEIENHTQSILRVANDYKEGVEAFLQKRKPEFKGN